MIVEKHATSQTPASQSAESFKPTELEARAIAVMQLLAAKPVSLALSGAELRKAEALASALRQGNKPAASLLSADFFQEVSPPEKLATAYILIRQQTVTANPEFQIVMDHLQEAYGKSAAIYQKPLKLDEALSLLLLAITRSDKNSISYLRIDSASGKPRPTTFPLSENLLRNFLAPFGDKQHLLQQCLIIRRGQVMANPAALLVQACRIRRQQFERAQLALQAAKDAEKKAAAKPSVEINPPAAEVQKQHGLQEVRLICAELEKILHGTQETAEQQAIVSSLQPESFSQLLEKASHQAGQDFGKLLEQLYAQHLSAHQAKFLSARLSSRFKRMMSKMGDWKEEYWQEYQSKLQSLGIWEGSEWLEKWRASKHGKQALVQIKQASAAEAKDSELQQMLQQADKIQDKLKGQELLTPPAAGPWQRNRSNPVSLELRRLLSALTRADRMDELLAFAVPDESWEGIPSSLRHRAYQIFCLFGDTDLDTIKLQFMSGIDQSQHEAAQSLILCLELTINKLVRLFKQDPRLSFHQALNILITRQQEIELREKQNSKAWQRTPVAQYIRYQQA